MMEKMAFLFPGQGSHFVGMSKGLYDQYEIVKQTFQEASDVLGYDLAKLCFDGPLSELSKAKNSQPAILVSSVASFRVYMQELGIVPQFLAGHSLGEYAAFTCAGAIRFADAVQLLHERGQLTDEVAASGVGAMSIVDGVDRKLVEQECQAMMQDGRQVWVSCYNSPNQTAISGDSDAVMELEDRLANHGGLATPLLASAPFHCSYMQPMADKLLDKLNRLPYGFFKYPVITNRNAEPTAHPDKVAHNLGLHLTQPVQWERTMNYFKHKGVTLAIEMGPKNVLTNMVKANVDGIEALCYGAKEDRKKIEQILSAYPGLRKHIPTIVTRSMAAAVATPNRNWDNEVYQEKVVKSYRAIQEIQDRLEETGSKPSLAEMRQSLDLLKVILDTKQVTEEEQSRWFHQIIDETGTYYELSDYLSPSRTAEKIS
ncbi:ACP S-malonyltransferase [Paenibacillus pasadenensis]|uniref:ACP S-malonyltransferase n=1 Tax=Paenibacillus pasadenensis TaxID=217090 RepID=UPI00203D842E|nr:ACP S-malonyltransferase [Paenibacillus pasadenensis]MCM3746394.1 ACP S-malonyltransferase [Paenibacillus pasadenensis]